MSSILYYSNYCDHCKSLLQSISRGSAKKDIHFVCIDRRTKRNGAVYVQLENGSELLMPPNIRSVPSLLLLNRGNVVVEGERVNEYVLQKNQAITQQATQFNGEPSAFSLSDFGSVVSDNYSFLDQSSDELSAKGTGGLRQMHNYVTIDHKDHIETPPDNYEPDKIGQDTSLDKMLQARERDVPRQPPRM